MALPTPVKTWQHTVNQIVASSGSAYDDHRKLLLAIKNALKGFASNAWQVVGSSDAAAAGLDGVDRWSLFTNIVFSDGTAAHSWIVLRQPAINPNFQVLIFCRPLSVYTASMIGFAVSPAAGFTGGSTTARPTATDEIVFKTGIVDFNNVWVGSSTASRNRVFHALQSTDGQCTRVIVLDSNITQAFWLFDKPQNPVAGWANPAVATMNGSNGTGTEWMTYGNFRAAAALRGRGTATMNVYLSAEGYGGGAVGENLIAPNDFDGTWPMSPVGLVSDTAGARGRHGTLFDVWWGATALNNGDTFPADASRQFALFGDLIVPWNGTNPLTA